MNKIVYSLFLLLLIVGFSNCRVNKYSSFNKAKKNVQLEGKSRKAIELTFSTKLNASAERVWLEFNKESFWIKMLNPKVILKRTDTIGNMIEGEAIEYKLKINRLIPFGKHYILWEALKSSTKTIQTREKGGYVKVWDNKVKIIELNDSVCVLVDQLLIYAGILTTPTSFWAKDVINQRHKNIQTYFNHK